MRQMRIAITADLHWGHRKGAEATRKLAMHLGQETPDLLVIAGDIGVGPMFEECLALFDGVDCPKALVPGNHDLWLLGEENSFHSLDLFERILPETANRHGFHYLDHAPLIFDDANLALAGTINWYDYSWGLEGLRNLFPAELERLATKRFSRGRHNDANFIRWPIDDVQFTSLVTRRLEEHLEQARGRVANTLVITHHPPLRDLGLPLLEPLRELDDLLWECFSGNAGMEQLLARSADFVPFAFCGHTHRAREVSWQGIRGYNIGGDYNFKRLLTLDWPRGDVTFLEFHED